MTGPYEYGTRAACHTDGCYLTEGVTDQQFSHAK